jgi:RNA 2',3'-cyclic 3'-phosphodiesterase
VPIPETLSPKLERLVQSLAAACPEARWELARPLHITLAFLGDVRHADLNDVCLAVAEEARSHGPFELTLEAIGAFPGPERPRVVWAGVGGNGLNALNALQAAIATTVKRLSYPLESRPFHAHVSLGRFGHKRPASDLSDLLHRHRRWKTGPFTVSEAVVFSSTLSREGPPVYAPLGRAPLRGKKPGATA